MNMTKFFLIFKIVVSILLCATFLTLGILSLVIRVWITAFLALFTAVNFGYIGFDALRDYWDYTEEDKNDKV